MIMMQIKVCKIVSMALIARKKEKNMKKIFIYIVLCVIISMMALAFVGCGDKGNQDNEAELERIRAEQKAEQLRIVSELKLNLPEGIEAPKRSLKQEVIFKTVDDVELKMIIQKPSEVVYEKTPVLFLITGGGFHTGDRNSMMSFMSSEIGSIRRDGFMICSIDYRLTADSVSMTQLVSDCMDGIRYLHLFADELNIDIDNINVCGHSAGGYLTLGMAEFTQASFYADSPYQNITYNLNTAIALSPLVSVHDFEGIAYLYDQPCMWALNSLFNLESYDFDFETVCPYHVLIKNICKTMVVHGDGDALVNYGASVKFAEKAQEIGADVTLVTSVNGSHSFSAADTRKPVSLSLGEVNTLVHNYIVENHK